METPMGSSKNLQKKASLSNGQDGKGGKQGNCC